MPHSIRKNSVDHVVINYQMNMLAIANSFAQSQMTVMLAYLQHCTKGGASSQQYPTRNNQIDKHQLLFVNGGAFDANNFQRVPPRDRSSDSLDLRGHTPDESTSENHRVHPSAASSMQDSEQGETNDGVEAERSEEKDETSGELVSTNVAESLDIRSSVDDLMEAFVSILSEKTGYPIDMLDPSLDLETDLGIDSIKRIEILSNFRKILPSNIQPFLESSMDEVAGARTIEEIERWIRAAFASC